MVDTGNGQSSVGCQCHFSTRKIIIIIMWPFFPWTRDIWYGCSVSTAIYPTGYLKALIPSLICPQQGECLNGTTVIRQNFLPSIAKSCSKSINIHLHFRGSGKGESSKPPLPLWYLTPLISLSNIPKDTSLKTQCIERKHLFTKTRNHFAFSPPTFLLERASLPTLLPSVSPREVLALTLRKFKSRSSDWTWDNN